MLNICIQIYKIHLTTKQIEIKRVLVVDNESFKKKHKIRISISLLLTLDFIGFLSA